MENLMMPIAARRRWAAPLHLNEAVGVLGFLVVGDIQVAAKFGHGRFHERLHVAVNLRRKMQRCGSVCVSRETARRQWDGAA